MSEQTRAPFVPDTPIELGDRGLYPELELSFYLNHAAISPASSWVQDLVSAAVTTYAQRGLDGFMVYIGQRERLKATLAKMLSVDATSVALTSGTTKGIVALGMCLPWRRGAKIVCFAGEFPANVTPWQQIAGTFGLDVVMASLAGFGDGTGDGLGALEDLLEAGDVQLVAVSAVQFQTGLRMPIEAMATLCHAHGAELFVDGIQACGVVPLDLTAAGVDYLVCGGHKWMMGFEGCGFAYVAPSAAEALVPRTAGWLSHEEGLRFLFEGAGHLRYDRPIKKTVDFLEGGAYHTLAFVALEAGVEPILRLGQPEVFAHVQAYHDELEAGLLEMGFTSARSPRPEARSGILSVRPPEGVDVVTLPSALKARGVGCSLPDGWLRFAPHWANGLGEVEGVLGAVEEVLG